MNENDSQDGEDRMLDWVYHVASGDTHKPVCLQSVWQAMRLPTEQMSMEQMRLLLCHLVEQGYLQVSSEADRTTVFLTPKAVKRRASVKTRR